MGRRGGILGLVLGQAFGTILAGIALGGLGATLAGLWIRLAVLRAAGVDLPALAGSAAVLAVVMLLASAVPAVRAVRVDPNAVLRES